MLSVTSKLYMLSVIMLNVITLSVMAPQQEVKIQKQTLIFVKATGKSNAAKFICHGNSTLFNEHVLIEGATEKVHKFHAPVL
jgi:hypothetical protein